MTIRLALRCQRGTVENLLPDHVDFGSRAVGQALCLRRPLRPPCSRVFINFGGPQGHEDRPSGVPSGALWARRPLRLPQC